MNRRELLHAFLGAAAVAACGKRPSPGKVEGELVMRREDLGHRLRDGPLIEPSADAWEDVGVVVVGAGAAGLAAAWRLARAGVDDVAILELDDVEGGTARSGRSAVGAYPWGAHYITAPMRENRALVTLLREMGVVEGEDDTGRPIVGESFLCREPEERVFYRGRWYEGLYLSAGAGPEDHRQYAAFDAEISRWVRWRDASGRRAFALPTAQASTDVEVTDLDKLSMAAWMDARGFDSPRLRWYADYACRDDYGSSLGDTSAWAALHYFCSRIRDPDAEFQPVVTWPEGNGRLIAELAKPVRERVRTGWAVAQLRPTADGVEVVALTEGGRVARGIRARQVIFAAPQLLRSRLLRDERDPAVPNAFEYGAWMVANLHLDGRLSSRGFEQAWDNVFYDSPSLGYVVSTHQRGLDHGPTVLTYYYPLLESDARAGRTRLFEAGWAEWAEIALSDLARAHPDARARTRRVDVMRWGHAMVRPKPGFVFGPDRALAAQPFRGVHFAHTDLSGVALFEEAFHHGLRAAEEVLAAREITSESML